MNAKIYDTMSTIDNDTTVTNNAGTVANTNPNVNADIDPG